MSNTIDTSISSASSLKAKGDASKSSAASDLQDNFMTLLVAQLKNQDPMNPMENAELTSQLAQINTVSGIEELNTTLAGITGQIGAGQTLQASALIGRGVLVPGDRILAGNGTTTPFGIELEQPAGEVKVSILDSSGAAVRQFNLGALEAGVESFVWDGKLEDGSAAPDGAYRVMVEASTDGRPQLHTTLHYAQVAGVRNGSNGPLLDLGATQGQVSLSDIRQIL